jgi:hypothetical protein
MWHESVVLGLRDFSAESFVHTSLSVVFGNLSFPKIDTVSLPIVAPHWQERNVLIKH